MMSTPLAQALAAYQRGEPEPALAMLQALPEAPEERLQALVLVVNAGIRFDRVDAAIAGLKSLSLLQPEESRWLRMLADALNQRGSQRREAGDSQGAYGDFDAALRLSLMHPLANYNAALVLQDLGDVKGALAHLQDHLHGSPEDAEAHLLLAELLAEAGQNERAELALEKALADPACPQGMRLAMALARIGRLQAAADILELLGNASASASGMEVAERIRQQGDGAATRRAYCALSKAFQSSGQAAPLRAALSSALHLDPVPDDAEQMASEREALAAGIGQLESDWTDAALAALTPDLGKAAWSNFYLAYQGRDDRELQSRYGDFLSRVTSTLTPALCEPMPPRKAGAPRVGFLSSFFRECTVGNYFGRWPAWLQEAGFEVHLFQLGPQRDATTSLIGTNLHRFVFHDGPLNDLAQLVRASDLDLLIYPEIGMDMRILPLAATRLARCQAAAWGHPVTTGLPSIDVFLSCADMEPDAAAAHYREELHLLPGLGVDYRGLAPSKGESGVELPLGLRVLIPQSGFKLHPDNDALIAQLAAQVPEAMFLLFQPERPRWRERLARRLQRAFRQAGADPVNQLHWLPQVPRQQYLRINRDCDLMLDSLHWSGGNTSLDALASGLPLLTCTGRFMRGRQSSAMLNRLGLAEQLVASDSESLLRMACSLLRDNDQRVALRSRIADGLPDLFESQKARERFVALAASLCPAV